MHLQISRLLLAVIPAIFAFFLASVFTVAISDQPLIATIVGVGAAMSSTIVILRH